MAYPRPLEFGRPQMIRLDDSPSVDAFGRLRVAEVDSQINIIQHTQEWNALISEETIGTGSVTYQLANSRRVLSTSATSDVAICQTYARGVYSAGKSLVFQMTMANFEPETNIIKRIGYFQAAKTTPFDDDKDGLFFESSSGVVSINIYKDGTATESTAQSDWNIDKLDGCGPSKITVDWSKAQIIQVDFQYLGVGRVRWNLLIDGRIVPIHESDHANNLDSVYMQSPDQPLRWEIRQTGAGSGSFNFICATVGIESFAPIPQTTYAGSSSDTYIGPLSTGTTYAIGGLRLRSNRLNDSPTLLRFDLLSGTQDAFRWEIRRDPTVAGTISWNTVDNASLEVGVPDNNNNTVTGGTILMAGLFDSAAATTLDVEKLAHVPFGSSIDGTPIEIYLCVFPLVNNATVLATGVWREAL